MAGGRVIQERHPARRAGCTAKLPQGADTKGGQRRFKELNPGYVIRCAARCPPPYSPINGSTLGIFEVSGCATRPG